MNSLMTDLGVERLLLRFPRIAINKLFPWADDNAAKPPDHPDLGFEDDGDIAAADPPAGEADLGPLRACAGERGDDDSDADSFLEEFTNDDNDSSDDGAWSESDNDSQRFAAPEPGPDGGSPMIDVNRVFHMGGPQHAIHGMVQDFKEIMDGWSNFVEELTHICRLLHHSYTRDRFFEQCCPAHVQLYITSTVNYNLIQVYEPRWGSVAGAVVEIGKVEVALRTHWDARKYNFHDNNLGGPGQQRPAEADMCDATIVDRSINSPRFWNYRRMSEVLCETINHMLNWTDNRINR
jgi:hypothetical protein